MQGPRFLIGATVGVMAGALVATLTMPLPETRRDCSTYRVGTKVATAYVLRPPPPLVGKCEPIRCPTVAAPPPEPEPVVEKEEAPRRHHRRHRVRRYWR